VFAASQDAGAAPGDPADPAGSGSAQPAAVPA
jgi:hypothetical protein